MQFDRDSLLQSKLFAPLHAAIFQLESDHFPTRDEVNVLLSRRRIKTESGCELRLVEPQSGKLGFEAQYEPRCYLSGEVATRADNWHDLFNALVWLSFPKIKAAINARHYRELISTKKEKGRGSMRDLNTLLDESGVIVAYADDRLSELLGNFQWRELFWQHREQVRNSMNFYIFGHGLYEKAMQPYVGMTGHGLLVRVDQDFLEMPIDRQLAHLDLLVAAHLAEGCHDTGDLSPVPLLGIPGWTEDNECAGYYDNTDYFRAGRRKKAV